MAPLGFDLLRNVSSHGGGARRFYGFPLHPTRGRGPGLRSGLAPRAGENLVGADQPLLSRTGEMHPDAGASRAAQIPSRRVKARRRCQVASIGGLHPIRERKALRARPGITQAHLAPGLQVEGVVVEGTRLAARDELGDGRKLALAHRRLEVGARLAMRASRAALALGQEDVALATERRELLLDRPHALSNLGDSALDLCVVECAEVISHQPRRRRRMRKAAATITNTIAAIVMVPLARSFTPDRKSTRL